MSTPRFPKYDYPAESTYCLGYAIFILAVIGIAAFLCRAGSNEAIRVATVVKSLECQK